MSMDNTVNSKPLKSGSKSARCSSLVSVTSTAFQSAISTPTRHATYSSQSMEKGSGEMASTTKMAIDASFKNDVKVSPMLAKLRMTPGRLLKDKQTILMHKHEEAQKKVDNINVGGGVSIWPEMVSMRMTKTEMYHLVALNIALCIVVIAVFYMLHGSTVGQLQVFHRQLLQFSEHQPVVWNQSQNDLDQSLVNWHTKYKQILDSVHEAFDVTKLPASYLAYMVLYIATLGVLLYYLIDNMFAKSKLSPKRIKRWVSLLVLTSTWTSLIALTLAIALRTEVAIETNIHYLSDTLANVIPTNLNCDKFNLVLQYWRNRCLPPTTHGTITIFGVLPVRDVTFYIQYYSIPIVTVLIMPVFRLIVSVMTIYNKTGEKLI